jgi:MoaA/NifB/PqqE/SkfB family radical SAM enzyme
MNAHTSFGNINENTIDEILSGDKIKKFKEDMNNGIVHHGCASCINIEKSGMHSYRQYFDDIVRDEELIVDINEPNKLYYADLRITNKCNLKCRMCVPQSSVLVAHDMKKIGQYVSDEELNITPAKDFDLLVQELEDKIKDLKIVYLAGGEPTIMNEQYKFIDYLIEKGVAKNIKIYCTSNINLRTLTYNHRNYIELLKNFKQIYFTVSIDGIYKKGEYIRKNLNYETWKENFKYLIEEQNNSNGKLKVNTYSTIGMYNLLHVFDLIDELLRLNGDNPDDIDINPLYTPIQYNATILPESIKNIYVEKLLEFELKYSNKKYSNLIKKLNSLKNHIYGENNIDALPIFFDFNNKLDKLRNEDFFVVFPELSILKEYRINEKLI